MRHCTEVDMPALAVEIIALVRAHNARGIALRGNLGSGKTTLTQHIARSLGVSEPVTSPTFVLLKSYTTHDSQYKTLVHIDAYRIENENDARTLRLGHYSRPDIFLCVEWPEFLGDSLPLELIPLHLEYVDETHRAIIGL